jgi:hypothetical protein
VAGGARERLEEGGVKDLDGLPLWSVWLRDYGSERLASEDHWVLFVVEENDGAEATCRVIATAVPLSTPSGTLAPGATFKLRPPSQFITLVKRLA